MAITPTAGATANTILAGASFLIFPSGTLTNLQTVIVCVSIDGTSTVSNISDSSGTNLYTFRSGVTNGSSVRSEIWSANITAPTASRTINVVFSSSSLASAAYEEYAGVSSIGNIATPATGTNAYPDALVLTQDSNNWVVGALAVDTNSGDTFSTFEGIIRQSIIPTLTTSSTALVDNTGIPVATYSCGIRVSNATRVWAATGLELRTGGTPVIITDSVAFVAPVMSPSYIPAPQIRSFIPAPQFKATTIGNALVNVAYSFTFLINNGGVTPYSFSIVDGTLPQGLTLNQLTGVISGTPTVLGVSAFTLLVEDRNGWGQLQTFSLQIVSTFATGGGSYTFVS